MKNPGALVTAICGFLLIVLTIFEPMFSGENDRLLQMSIEVQQTKAIKDVRWLLFGISLILFGVFLNSFKKDQE